ncbi:MAG: tetratricopeptide repeat protein [Planctomycetota bacterium]
MSKVCYAIVLVSLTAITGCGDTQADMSREPTPTLLVSKLPATLETEVASALAVEDRNNNREYFLASHGPERIAMWGELAEAGIPEAMWLSAWASRYGVGVKEDWSRAHRLCKKASEAGFVPATLTYADLIRTKEGGGDEVIKLALEITKKASDAGYVPATRRLGWLAARGVGEPGGDEAAVDYYESAIAEGSTAALLGLGYMKEVGRGTPQDMEGAVDLYEQARSGGSGRAITNLAKIYWHGHEHIPADREKAILLYCEAVRLGDRIAIMDVVGGLTLGSWAWNDREPLQEALLAAQEVTIPHILEFIVGYRHPDPVTGLTNMMTHFDILEMSDADSKALIADVGHRLLGTSDENADRASDAVLVGGADDIVGSISATSMDQYLKGNRLLESAGRK